MSKTSINCRIKKYAYCDIEQIYKEIDASPNGLTYNQIKVKRNQYGSNSFTKNDDTFLYCIYRAFINPFNMILLVLGIISLITDVILVSNFTKNATTAIIIFSMILISGTIRLIQEFRAKNASKQLERLIHETITVKRNGIIKEISADELVVGDIVLLSAGDRVPADIRLSYVKDLFVSQAAITGESVLLEKHSHTLHYGDIQTFTQLDNIVFMETTVISGKGEGIVLAVGEDTLYGSFTQSNLDKTIHLNKALIRLPGSCFALLRFLYL